LIDLDVLVADFSDAAARAAVDGWACPIGTERLPAPHLQPTLRTNYGAVYAFALSPEAGRRAPAGAGTVLKVGEVSPTSAARFSSQHYNPGSAGSSLAKSLIRYRILWSWLGVDHLDETSVKAWMLANLERAHFYVPGDRPTVRAELETYVRARIGSVFEGAA
jgi:hypothetical protein